jgi:hypothetical protein
MISITTIPCKGKQNILIGVIANPLIAAFGFGQVGRLSAKPASGSCFPPNAF